MIRNKLALVGVASVTALAGCGEQSPSAVRPSTLQQPLGALPVRSIVAHELNLYGDGFVDSLANKTGVLRSQAGALAICYLAEKSSTFDTIYVQTASGDGYVGVNEVTGVQHNIVDPAFSTPQAELQSALPECGPMASPSDLNPDPAFIS